MEKLHCHVQNYAWGKKGMQSEVARIYRAGHDDAIINDNLPYAELWMGTHPDGPARLKTSQKKLSDHIFEQSKSFFNRISGEKHLPFIMKLMSVNQSLSLQVHPNKKQAAQLNDRDPVNYPDRNHKPELVYALTRFELLCGFRPAEEIAKNIATFDELRHLMGDQTSRAFKILVDADVDQTCETLKAALAVCFRTLLNNRCDQNLSILLQKMLAKLDRGERGCLTDRTVEVIRKMYDDFPDDIGCFSPLFLNHLILEPGDCCYYAPQELHAYLSGECVECVGCSNNTIRAACTPKFIDVDSLCDVLSYRMTDPSYYMLEAKKLELFPHVAEYAPDCKDFILHKIMVPELSSTSSPLAIPSFECESIMVIVEGSGLLENFSNKKLHEPELLAVSCGDIIYIESRAQLGFVECTGSVTAYRTFSYEPGPDHSTRQLATVSKVTVQKRGRRKFVIMNDEDSSILSVETDMDGIC